MQTSSSATTTKLSAAAVRDYLEPYEFGLDVDGLKENFSEDTLCKLARENTREPRPGIETFFCPIAVVKAYEAFIDRYGRHHRFGLEFTSDPVVVAGYRASMEFIGFGDAETVVNLNRDFVTV